MPTSTTPPFHLAIPVIDLERTRAFYIGVLGCREGRSDTTWVDFDLVGHQISAHRVAEPGALHINPVDGDAVPVPHFGIVLPWEQWGALAERLRALELKGGIDFVIAPHIRFAGQIGEQATMFLLDPSGNALEFKAFKDPRRLFAR